MLSDTATRRLFRRAYGAFIAWRHRRRVRKAEPQFLELERLLEQRRREHKPVADIMQRKMDLVHDRLRQENGRKAA
jgi:hypothetical protein